MSKPFSTQTLRRAPVEHDAPYRAPGDATGLRILVTGANAGIGFWTSLQLAQRGAEVIMACRNEAKAQAAASAILARVPKATLRHVRLDVSSLASVADAVEELGTRERLDVLIANAGMVHAPRTRQLSVDGLELVSATNYFGHFALISGLLPALERAAAARVVMLGSLATLLVGRPRLEDAQLVRNYSAWRAYAQSKVMTQSFGFELDRRLQLDKSRIRSLVAHPGYSISGRTQVIEGVNEPRIGKRALALTQGAFTQGKNHGAWPVVRAALDAQAFSDGGPAFYGPRGLVRGGPARTRPASITTDCAKAELIWKAAETATGIRMFG